MKNKMKHIFRSLVAGVMVAASICSLASCSFQEVKDDVTSNITSGVDKVKDKIGISLMSTEYIQLASDEAVDEDYSKFPAQKITATVLPSTLDASEKLVDWSVDWIENKTGDETAVASDYIKLVPTADGSTDCTVVCVKAFLGSSIGVKVTTRIGSYTALCTVTYIGTPTYLGFFNSNEDGTFTHISGAVSVIENATTAIRLNLDNVFNLVGSTFGNFEIVETGAIGTYKAQAGVYTNNSGWLQSSIVDRIPTFSSFVNDVSIVDGELIINAGNTIESFDKRYENAGGRREVYISGAENVQFYVIVRDTVSGVDNTFFFRIVSVVESVALDVTNMSF